MDLHNPTNTNTGESLLVMVANNTANLRRNSIELKELLVALQQQVNELSEQVIILQAQVSDLNGQLMVERQGKVHTSPSHASLHAGADSPSDGERTRRSSKQPRVRYYRHDSGPPGLGSPSVGIGVGGGESGEQCVTMAD
ncbi:hypothetical protein CLAFUW4_03942 [Fulvia fulva]|uniref:Uncharacterized protein n=1 Tax=Passalora fulva TaxID=5499 RepID=A0A9Q8LF03_PASFU|nr:uncharacterized protein CLAFUR5_03910 [Fulvia fulva]KAK4626425.1 hypothetical protein CLAFUR4_03928 [Fulvia fulva]KAK4628477.1 hypothetical protein CLAFUR0_03929 [Fulvia fulva]UJO16196.1 hypothetical protein CLAFUR5_03910 [Fulvia fulva]WPV13503.1 hypothetical protein CLAFUW4_03942 [Fulvia fulva]WPV28916.1 hypothetical protein CLAFUW7_03931 [Fulvia fulva]